MLMLVVRRETRILRAAGGGTEAAVRRKHGLRGVRVNVRVRSELKMGLLVRVRKRLRRLSLETRLRVLVRQRHGRRRCKRYRNGG